MTGCSGRLQEESLRLPQHPRAPSAGHQQLVVAARSKVSRLPGPRSGRVSAGSSQEDLLGNPLRAGVPAGVSPRRGGENWSGFSPPISPYTSNGSLNATNGGKEKVHSSPAPGAFVRLVVRLLAELCRQNFLALLEVLRTSG